MSTWSTLQKPPFVRNIWKKKGRVGKLPSIIGILIKDSHGSRTIQPLIYQNSLWATAIMPEDIRINSDREQGNQTLCCWMVLLTAWTTQESDRGRLCVCMCACVCVCVSVCALVWVPNWWRTGGNCYVPPCVSQRGSVAYLLTVHPNHDLGR